MLSPYRVLDLTEGGCMVAGKILGDLGADVIKIEPVGGSPSRRQGPFYGDDHSPERSLYWFAYNTNKRGITLNVADAKGRELLRRLVATADILIESFPVGYLAGLGLGYDDLAKVKEDIIVTSITPYGQIGPKAAYPGTELTAWASGGTMFVMGDAGRPPVWMGFPQAFLHGGAEAASASMHALWYRNRTGVGQHADVSIQQCVISVMSNTTGMWECHHFDYMRQGWSLAWPNATIPSALPCKDGVVAVLLMGGAQMGVVGSMKALVQWMDEEAFAPQWLKDFDWVYDFDASAVTQETVDKVAGAITKFLLTKTKAELYEGAVRRRIMLAASADAKDVWQDPQLRARQYWAELEHPELGAKVPYCGPPIRHSEMPWQLRRRAPLIGEHNEEIYVRELGLSPVRVAELRQAGAI